MQVDAHISYSTLHEVPDLVRQAERFGVDGVWCNETAHDPFLGAAIAAEHTTRVQVGTSIALAFTRSPTLLAHLAWDLAALSRGRFTLGLGTQVKAHIERRFGVPWEAPAARLKETVQAIQAVWHCWRTGTPLNYRGRFYHLTLMTPFFTPPRLDVPIPIVTAGVNPLMCRIAGEVADGFQVHPFHTTAYLRDVIRPAIAQGRARAGREQTPFSMGTTVFAVSGATQQERDRVREDVKRAIAFYASTRTYRAVLAHHGWEAAGRRLGTLAARGAWDAMAQEISDEMLATIAVVAPVESLGLRIRERYAGLIDRIGLYAPFSPAFEAQWRSLLTAVRT